VGGLCIEGFNALFHKVNPLLEMFFQSIVDGNTDGLSTAGGLSVLEGGSRRITTTGEELITNADETSSKLTARRAISNPLTAMHSSTPRYSTPTTPRSCRESAASVAHSLQPPSATEDQFGSSQHTILSTTLPIDSI